MVKSFSQNFVKYRGCGVYFVDGTLLLDEKHRGVHHKKCFLPVTKRFWKRPEETRSQLQKKNVFFENLKNKYLKYLLTKNIKNRFLLSSYSESESDDESTDSESSDDESGRLFVTPLIDSSDNDSEQTKSQQTTLPDEIKSTLKNMIKETIADKIESNVIEIENEIENNNKDNMSILPFTISL